MAVNLLKTKPTHKKKPIPFEFALEELANHSHLKISTKPMFGCVGVYSGLKIVLILRERDSYSADNGVWLATTAEHHASLKKLFSSLRSITVFGDGETGWQVLPADAEDFESSVLKACELIAKDDPRIGKIPKTKMRKSKAKTIKKRRS